MGLNYLKDGVGFATTKNKSNKKFKQEEIFISSEKKKGINYEEYIKLNDDNDDYFQLIPFIPFKRQSILIIGRNGSGKSYAIRLYLLEFHKRYPDYIVRLISSKDTDETLDDLPFIKRCKIDDSWITDPIKYIEFKDSLVIFDDVDGFKGELRKIIYDLRDIILANGRSDNIFIISTNHQATGRDIQVPLNESDCIIFFMANYNRSLRYLLESYVGLEKDQIEIVKRIKSRACVYIKTFPNVLLFEKLITTFKGLDIIVNKNLKKGGKKDNKKIVSDDEEDEDENIKKLLALIRKKKNI